MRALREAGVFFVILAGNSGYSGCGSVDAPPAIYDEVYTVGSVNYQNEISDFNSLGPVTVDGSSRVKPDILAPGEDIFSSYPNDTYEVTSGTSMAAPHVVGVVALMWSASPKLIGNVEKTEEMLNENAIEYNGSIRECEKEQVYPNNAAGYGIVNAYEAVELAIDYENQ